MSPEEAAAYRLQVEQEMRDALAAIREEVDQEMVNFANRHFIPIDDTVSVPDTDTDTDDNEDDNTNISISMKDFLELMKNIRIHLAGPLPGEPNANYLTKKPPDNSEGEGHAYPVSAGGKKNKKKRTRKTKRKRKKKKRKTKRR